MKRSSFISLFLCLVIAASVLPGFAEEAGSPSGTILPEAAPALFTGEDFILFPLSSGFSVPVFADDEKFETGFLNTQLISRMRDSSGPYFMVISHEVYADPDFLEDPSRAEARYSSLSTGNLDIASDEIISLGGHPARMVLGRMNGSPFGVVFYARNNRILVTIAEAAAGDAGKEEAVPEITAEEMKALTDQIVYDPSQAAITVADGALTITEKSGASVLPAGKKLTFSASFANPDRVNSKNKNNAVEWSLADPDGGEAPADITLSAKGVLSAPKTLSEPRQVEVRVSSPLFHTEASWPVTVLPAASGITVEPAELVFYTGTNDPQSVKAVLQPDTVPPIGLSWTPAKKDIVEITETAPGAVSIRPLAAGKTAVSVKEPGGKTAKLAVSVVKPVESVELTASGKAVPGGTVTVKAVLLPKDAGNKAVEWSLDVGDEIASVSGGKVKISKGAPAGTVITVTCTAPGAPQPPAASVRIVVAEK